MLKRLDEYEDEQAILEEMAERAEAGKDTDHYQEDVRWLIARLISESETVSFYNLDSIEQSESLRNIGSVLHMLGTYAKDRAQAIDLRLKGREEDALEFDRSCQAIFNKLPEWAKWEVS